MAVYRRYVYPFRFSIRMISLLLTPLSLYPIVKPLLQMYDLEGKPFP